MAIFNSYVKLPEGRMHGRENTLVHRGWRTNVQPQTNAHIIITCPIFFANFQKYSVMSKRKGFPTIRFAIVSSHPRHNRLSEPKHPNRTIRLVHPGEQTWTDWLVPKQPTPSLGILNPIAKTEIRRKGKGWKGKKSIPPSLETQKPMVAVQRITSISTLDVPAAVSKHKACVHLAAFSHALITVL